MNLLNSLEKYPGTLRASENPLENIKKVDAAEMANLRLFNHWIEDVSSKTALPSVKADMEKDSSKYVYETDSGKVFRMSNPNFMGYIGGIALGTHPIFQPPQIMGAVNSNVKKVMKKTPPAANDDNYEKAA